MHDKDPTVSVITPTFNRPRYLRTAVESVVNQTLEDWELLVVNDGGEDVRHVVDAFSDDRIRYFHRSRNEGKAACLNVALRRARGRYVAYLDDDDLWYPDHLETLAGALGDNPGYGAAYSDPYEVFYVKGRGGRRYPLQKRARFCRHFSRNYMFIYNHVLPVCLMHRKELALRAGGYDEDVTVLIDWNMNRKLCFYTDFLHVPRSTGEHYVTCQDSDRISDLQRRDMARFRRNVRRIRADLPPEPWPHVARVAVLFPVRRWNERTKERLQYFADRLAHPHRMALVYPPAGPSGPPDDAETQDILSLSHVRELSVGETCSEQEMYARAAARVEGDYYYLASPRANTDGRHRIIRALTHLRRERSALAVRWSEEERSGLPGDVFVRRSALRRELFPYPAAQPQVHVVGPHELPTDLQVDRWLIATERCLEEGDLQRARKCLEVGREVEEGGIGDPHVAHLEARIAFQTGEYDRAEPLAEELMERGYVPDNAVRLGRIHRERGQYEQAARCYRHALQAIGLSPGDLEDDIFPVLCRVDCDGYRALLGLGESLAELDRTSEASACLRAAAGLRADAAEAYAAFGELLLQEGMLRQAEESFHSAVENSRGELRGRSLRGLAGVWQRRGDTAEAWKWAARAAHTAPEDGRNVRLADAFGPELEEYEELARLHEQHLEYCPGDLDSLRRLTALHHRLGNSGEARSCARRLHVLANADSAPAAAEPAVEGGGTR